MEDVDTSGTFINRIKMQLQSPRNMKGWLNKVSH